MSTKNLIDLEINQQKLTELYGDDNDFKQVVFQTFLTEIDKQFSELKASRSSENWEMIGKISHKIKPSMAMVGLINTENSLREIETSIKNEIYNKEILAKVDYLLGHLESIKKLVQLELDNL